MRHIVGTKHTKDKEAGPFGIEKGDGRSRAGASRPHRDAEAIQAWLIDKLSELLKTDPEQIDVRAPFVSYGLGSVQGVTLAGELEQWLDYKLPATLVWDYPDVESMARHLAEELRRDAPPDAALYKN